MHTEKRLIHSVAQCRNCDWENTNYRKAAAAATEHSKQNPGHVVNVEQGYSYQVTTPK